VAQLKSFMIECGNSSTGPLGMCMRVTANTRQQAIDLANEFLERRECVEVPELDPAIEYCNVYLAGNLKIGRIVAGDTETL
jgi:hypothetical protein